MILYHVFDGYFLFLYHICDFFTPEFHLPEDGSYFLMFISFLLFLLFFLYHKCDVFLLSPEQRCTFLFCGYGWRDAAFVRWRRGRGEGLRNCVYAVNVVVVGNYFHNLFSYLLFFLGWRGGCVEESREVRRGCGCAGLCEGSRRSLAVGGDGGVTDGRGDVPESYFFTKNFL